MAIIKRSKLDDVREVLSEIGVKGVALTQVKGFVRQKGHTELYRDAEHAVDFLLKIKIEVAIPDAHLGRALETIVEAASTGKIGDCTILATNLEQVIRIRTDETGESAV